MHPRIPRAEHIGSLRRPDALQRARTAHAAGACTADALRACEDAAVAEAVRLQRETEERVEAARRRAEEEIREKVERARQEALGGAEPPREPQPSEQYGRPS